MDFPSVGFSALLPVPATAPTYTAMSSDASPSSSTQNEPGFASAQSGRGVSTPGIPGAPVEVFVIGYQIWSWTTWVNVSDVMPASRAWANASSRFGPMGPAVPASASVWQLPHALTKSCFPAPWLPSLVDSPLPHAARDSV